MTPPLLAVMQGREFARLQLVSEFCNTLTSIGTRQSTLWIHDSRGDRQVTSEGYAFQPTFSADGKKLFYLVRTSDTATTVLRGSLWIMDIATGERQRLLSDYLMENYAISQDGQRIVFVAAAGTQRGGVWLATLWMAALRP